MIMDFLISEIGNFQLFLFLLAKQAKLQPNRRIIWIGWTRNQASYILEYFI